MTSEISLKSKAVGLAVLACILLNLLFLTPAVAAPSLGTTISPPFQEVVITQNQTVKNFDLSVQNTTSAVQTFKLSVQDFGALDETGGVAFLGTSGTALEHKYGLASWLGLSADTLTIAPHATTKVGVRIDNRPSLSPGGHYGAILLTSQGEPGAPATPQVVVTQVLSTLVFVKKVGGEEYKLLLNRLEAPANLWRLPSKIKLRFQNSGNVHVVPRGTVETIDPRGRLVAKGIINEESGIVLPESFRMTSTTLTQTTTAWLPGRYQEKVKYRFDGQTDFTTSTSSVYYLGRSGTFILMAVGLVLLTLITWFIVNRRRQTAPKNIQLD